MRSHRQVWVNSSLTSYFIMVKYLDVMEISINKVFYSSQKMMLWAFRPKQKDEVKKLRTKPAILLSSSLMQVPQLHPRGSPVGKAAEWIVLDLWLLLGLNIVN